jgi:hypothetical protein
MTRRRRLGAALITLGAVTLILGFTAAPVHAQAPDASGWWFELQTKSVPVTLPSPPSVPAGGLFVQQGANGPTAYGAVRSRLKNAADATLTLTAAQGSTAAVGSLQACATGGWSPPSSGPGYWEDAPKFHDPCTPGAVSSDNKFVAFFFSSDFVKSGVLDVAIVPKGATPFAIAFEKPAPDSLKVTIASSPTPTTTPTTLPIVQPSTGGGSISAAPAAAPAATPAPAPAPSSDDRSPIANAVLNAAGLGDPDRGERAAALGGASLIVIGWWLLSTQSVRMPRLLGGVGAAVVTGDDAAPQITSRMGGVARFSRKRDRNALALR